MKGNTYMYMVRKQTVLIQNYNPVRLEKGEVHMPATVVALSRNFRLLYLG